MSELDRAIDQLSRFPTTCHEALIATAVTSPRVAQLAFSFPLLLFLLAVGYGSEKERAAAIEAVDTGRPLSDAAAALSLPFSLRRLPPEACCKVPYAVWSEAASRELASLMPKTPAASAVWTRAIFNANQTSDERFALWLARQRPLFTGRELPELPVRGLAIYAWCSRYCPLPLTPRLSTAWQDDVGLDTACARAGQWAREIAIVADLTPSGIDDSWVPPATVMGFTFVPLLTPEDLIGEASAMSNCVATYSDRLSRGTSRLFGVRSKDQHVATVEIDWVSAKLKYGIREMRGPRNTTCSEDIVRAAYRWLDRYAPAQAPKQSGDRSARSRIISALLAPYQDAHATVSPQSVRNAIDMLLHVDLVRAELWLATRSKVS